MFCCLSSSQQTLSVSTEYGQLYADTHMIIQLDYYNMCALQGWSQIE